jgi:3-dehydroquinate synthase
MSGPQSIDVPFAVPFVHRLRFTQDVLGAERNVLLDLLEPSGDRAPRVQFWLDEHVAAARPDLRARLESLAADNPGRIRQAGNVQIVGGGEATKNDIHVLERMLKVFNAADLDRRSYVVVIGGGAVLDAVGFAAAIAHRGIRLVRIPTTTLAQADSGVGVKNGVNLFAKKNWLGSFAVPWAVINDASMLSTLPDRDFVCGFSEAVKVTLLKDEPKFRELCRDAKRIRARDMSAAGPVIAASAKLH